MRIGTCLFETNVIYDSYLFHVFDISVIQYGGYEDAMSQINLNVIIKGLLAKEKVIFP